MIYNLNLQTKIDWDERESGWMRSHSSEWEDKGGNGSVSGFCLISVRRGNRKLDKPWLMLTRKGKEGEWIIQPAIIKISVGLSFLKVKFCLGRGGALPLNWIWAVGCREREIGASGGNTLSLVPALWHLYALFSPAFGCLAQGENKRGHWNGVVL